MRIGWRDQYLLKCCRVPPIGHGGGPSFALGITFVAVACSGQAGVPDRSRIGWFAAVCPLSTSTSHLVAERLEWYDRAADIKLNHRVR